MSIYTNCIFGYGLIFNYSLVDSTKDVKLFELIFNICEENDLTIAHDSELDCFDVFIRIDKYSVQNGSHTYTEENGFNSKKDYLTSSTKIEFEITEEEKNKVYIVLELLKKYDKKNKYIIDEPRWIMFTYNS
jgi:hypothetical protein